MSFIDLITLVISNLNRMRGRVIMTAMGVVIGTAAIVVLISLSSGLQASTVENFESFGSLNQITIFSGAGRFGGIDTNSDPLTPERINELKQIEGVETVTPRIQLTGGSTLKFNRMQGFGSIYGIEQQAVPFLNFEMAQGTSELNPGTIIIGGYVDDGFEEVTSTTSDQGGGFPGPGGFGSSQQDSGPNPDAPDLYGQTIMLEITRNNEGQQQTRTVRLLVSGVMEPTGSDQDYSIYMSIDDMEDLITWSQGQRPNWQQDGYSEVLVITEQDAQVALEVQEAITDLGYFAISSTSIVESLNTTFLVIQAVLGGVASIALLVAAIGIANTMVMSVLERTREIGLMKAIGARNRDVLSVFITEAGTIGLLGGIVGVLLGVGIAQIIDLLAAGFLSTSGAESSSIIRTPVWLPLFAIGFSVVIGLVAGIYPAFRAVQLNPVQALKYE